MSGEHLKGDSLNLFCRKHCLILVELVIMLVLFLKLPYIIKGYLTLMKTIIPSQSFLMKTQIPWKIENQVIVIYAEKQHTICTWFTKIVEHMIWQDRYWKITVLYDNMRPQIYTDFISTSVRERDRFWNKCNIKFVTIICLFINLSCLIGLLNMD